jgi:uncharacterized membrane protein YphA (DoxX/SURF4 family)
VSAGPASAAEPSPRSRFVELFLHPWLTVRVSIALGLFFIVASLPKLGDPPSFAHMIYNYRILPGVFVNLAALVMPWTEILSGMALVLGLWRRSAAALIGVMLVVFIVAISFNLARDNAIDCGCFDTKSAGKSYEQKIDDMRFVVIRDVGMLMMVAQILLSTRRRGQGESGAESLAAAGGR